MIVRAPLRIATLVPVACAAALLAGCGSSGGGTPTTVGNGSQPASGTSGGGSQPASGTSGGGSQPAGTSGGGSQPASGGSSGSGAKCTDLTAAAASAALGKTVSIALDSGSASLPGLTICDVTVADEVYPIQLSVDSNDGGLLYTGDDEVSGGTALSGVGDKAFTSAIGVETLSGSVDIKVIGPAGPVLSGNFATPTAIAKAMVAALQ
jgi:hypothetical protein